MGDAGAAGDGWDAEWGAGSPAGPGAPGGASALREEGGPRSWDAGSSLAARAEREAARGRPGGLLRTQSEPPPDYGSPEGPEVNPLYAGGEGGAAGPPTPGLRSPDVPEGIEGHVMRQSFSSVSGVPAADSLLMNFVRSNSDPEQQGTRGLRGTMRSMSDAVQNKTTDLLKGIQLTSTSDGAKGRTRAKTVSGSSPEKVRRISLFDKSKGRAGDKYTGLTDVAEGDEGALDEEGPGAAPLPGAPMFLTCYILLFAIQMCMNLDAGALPASLSALHTDPKIHLPPWEQGVLGSCIYLGMIPGSLLAGPLLQKARPKRILWYNVVANCGFCLLFSLSPTSAWLFVTRLGAGFSKAVLAIFVPLWVDCTAPEHKLTLYMSVFQGAAPLGVMAGYLFAGLVQSSGVQHLGVCGGECADNFLSWRIPFFAQGLIFLPLMIIFYAMPRESMDLVYRVPDADAAAAAAPPAAKGAAEPPAAEKKPPARPRGDSGAQPKGAWAQVKELCGNRMYLYLINALSALFFVVTGIQFWVTNYLTAPVAETGLGFDFKTVVIGFALTSATAPVMGVIFGGVSVDKLGGYRKKDVALTASMGYALIAVVSGILVAFISNFYLIIIFLWTLLFFGAAIVPVATGLYVTAVKPELRAIASSMAMVVMQSLGYCLSPVLCGVLAQFLSLRWGFRTVLFWSFFGLAFLYGAYKEAVPNSSARGVLSSVFALFFIRNKQGQTEGLISRETSISSAQV